MGKTHVALTQPMLIFAKDAEPGREYLNWTGLGILIRKQGLKFEYRDTGGDMAELDLAPGYPLLVDAAALKVSKEAHERARKVFLWKCGAKSAETAAARPAAARPSAARGSMNAKTGYAEGTDGHRFGLVALELKGRPKVVEGIQKLLLERFDAKKARALAQSWVSTLIRKRPDIYGGLKGAK